MRMLTDYFEDSTISLAINGINNDDNYGNNVEIDNNITLLHD